MLAGRAWQAATKDEKRVDGTGFRAPEIPFPIESVGRAFAVRDRNQSGRGFITFAQVFTKSCANCSLPPSQAHNSFPCPCSISLQKGAEAAEEIMPALAVSTDPSFYSPLVSTQTS
jgi:hypothetical protein